VREQFEGTGGEGAEMQADARGPDVEPEGQAAHMLEPGDSAAVPAGHGRQELMLVLPSVREKVPGGQPTQAEELAEGA
jgi:hypothetical protein